MIKQSKNSESLNTFEDMKDYVKPNLRRKNPEMIIIPLGTNDIPSKEAPEIMNKMRIFELTT